MRQHIYLISFIGTDKKGLTVFGNDTIWLDDNVKLEDIPEIKECIARKQGLVAVTVLNAMMIERREQR